MRQILPITLLAIWAHCPLLAQTVVPVTSAYGHLVMFQDGVFSDVDARPARAVYPCGTRLAYITDAGDLKVFEAGKVVTMQSGEDVAVEASRYLLAWKTGPALRIPGKDGGRTLCRSVGRYTVSDSLIAFHDQFQQTLSVYWQGTVVPVADVLVSGGEVPWKTGSNALLLYDTGNRRVLLFQYGRTSVLCNGTDSARSGAGGDIVAFMDEYDDTFHVLSKGQTFDIERFAPVSFQMGQGLVAYVTGTGAFRCFTAGRVWDISNYAPDAYWVRDSVVVFRDQGNFKVFCNGATATLERTMPVQWAAAGNLVAWLDTGGVLRLFQNGQRIAASPEAGIDRFELYPDAVSFRSRSGANKVWWRGKLYEHY